MMNTKNIVILLLYLLDYRCFQMILLGNAYIEDHLIRKLAGEETVVYNYNFHV